MTRSDWRPVSGLIHAYRDGAEREFATAHAERNRRGDQRPLRIKARLHGWQVQILVARDEK